MSNTTPEAETTPAPETTETQAAPVAAATAPPKSEASPERAEAEAAGDDYLSKVLGTDPKSKPEPETDTSDDGDPGDEQPDGDAGETAPQAVDQSKIREAKAMLARLGMDADYINSLPADKLIAKATEKKPHFDRIQAAFNNEKELAATRAEIARLKAQVDAAKPDPVKSVLEKYRGIIEPEDVEALQAAIKSTPAKTDTPAIDPARAKLARTLVEANRVLLAKDFPQLSKQESLTEVYHYLTALDPDGAAIDDPDGFADVFRRAVQLAHGNPAKASVSRDALRAKSAAVSRGQPEAPGTNPRPKTALSKDDRLVEAAQMFIDRDPQAKAKAERLVSVK